MAIVQGRAAFLIDYVAASHNLEKLEGFLLISFINFPSFTHSL